MIQTFSQLHRINQGSAAPVIAVVPVQVLSRNLKCGNASAVVAYFNFGQSATAAQQKCTLVQIGHFDGTFHFMSTNFPILIRVHFCKLHGMVGQKSQEGVDMITLGQKIKQLRDEKGLSQSELEKKAV
jgi:hypothetical protein